MRDCDGLHSEGLTSSSVTFTVQLSYQEITLPPISKSFRTHIFSRSLKNAKAAGMKMQHDPLLTPQEAHKQAELEGKPPIGSPTQPHAEAMETSPTPTTQVFYTEQLPSSYEEQLMSWAQGFYTQVVTAAVSQRALRAELHERELPFFCLPNHSNLAADVMWGKLKESVEAVHACKSFLSRSISFFCACLLVDVPHILYAPGGSSVHQQVREGCPVIGDSLAGVSSRMRAE